MTSDPVLSRRTPLASQAAHEAERLARECAEGQDETWVLRGAVFQECADCRRVFYPPQALCPDCLSGRLAWHRASPEARLLGSTKLHTSVNDWYSANGPWRVGLVAHESGPNLFAFLDEASAVGEPVTLLTVPDGVGEAVLVAARPGDGVATYAIEFARRLHSAWAP